MIDPDEPSMDHGLATYPYPPPNDRFWRVALLAGIDVIAMNSYILMVLVLRNQLDVTEEDSICGVF